MDYVIDVFFLNLHTSLLLLLPEMPRASLHHRRSSFSKAIIDQLWIWSPYRLLCPSTGHFISPDSLSKLIFTTERCLREFSSISIRFCVYFFTLLLQKRGECLEGQPWHQAQLQTPQPLVQTSSLNKVMSCVWVVH